MNKKGIVAAIAAVIVLGLGFILYEQSTPDEYVPADDEIVLRVQLDIKEDVGLLIFDYNAGGHEYSGGMSNADKSLIKRYSENILVWNQQQLNSSSDTVELSVQFRIITEYVEPNYENNFMGSTLWRIICYYHHRRSDKRVSSRIIAIVKNRANN